MPSPPPAAHAAAALDTGVRLYEPHRSTVDRLRASTSRGRLGVTCELRPEWRARRPPMRSSRREARGAARPDSSARPRAPRARGGRRSLRHPAPPAHVRTSTGAPRRPAPTTLPRSRTNRGERRANVGIDPRLRAPREDTRGRVGLTFGHLDEMESAALSLRRSRASMYVCMPVCFGRAIGSLEGARRLARLTSRGDSLL